MTGKTDLLGPLERSLQVFLRDEGVLLGVLEAWEGGMDNIFTYTHTRARTHTHRRTREHKQHTYTHV